MALLRPRMMEPAQASEGGTVGMASDPASSVALVRGGQGEEEDVALPRLGAALSWGRGTHSHAEIYTQNRACTQTQPFFELQ